MIPELFGDFEEEQPAGPVFASDYKSEWLYDEIDSVYHAPYGKHLSPQPHHELCGIIEEAIGDCQFNSGGQKFVMIGVPRGSLKTTIAAENVPPVILTRNPEARGLIAAFRYDVAQKRMAAARQHFESNPKFREKYGDDWVPQFRERPWSNEQLTVMHRKSPLIDASLTAAGTDRSMVGSHFDFIIADDLVQDVNSRTRDQREKVYQYIENLYPMLEPNGTLIMIFTRWHIDDAYGRIIRHDETRVRDGEKPFWKKVVRGCYDGPGGLYYPDRLGHEELRNLKSRLTPRTFSAQYLLQPIADEDKTFNMDLKRMVSFNFEPRQFGGMVTIPSWAHERLPVETTLYWDPAGPKNGGKRNDFHGVTVVGCDPMDRWWVCEAEEIKDTASGIIDRIIKLVVYYHVRTVGIEDVGMQLLWMTQLQTEMDKRGIPMPGFAEVSTGGVPKNVRIELALSPRWDRGHLIIQPNQTRLYEQLDAFSPQNEDHEDILDSLAGHQSIARPASPDFTYVRDDNPVDREWIQRRERLKKEMLGEKAPKESGAGMHGVSYLL